MIASTRLPRPAHWLELVIGGGFAAAAALAIAVPLLVDPFDRGPLGPLLTPVLLGVLVSVGALIAGGPRGRARLGALILGSNRRYVRGRQYVMTWERSRTLTRLGRTPAIAVILLGGALVCFAKPVLGPLVERGGDAATGDLGPPGLPPLSAAMRAELDTAAAAGDPEAIAVRSLYAPDAAEGSSYVGALAFDEYTAERNVAWPSTGLVLLLLALWLVASPGGLSRAAELAPESSADVRRDGALSGGST